jgi:hypothetical protein
MMFIQNQLQLIMRMTLKMLLKETHISSPHLELEASRQLQYMSASFVATPNSMEAFVITKNHTNQGLQANHIHLQQNPSENEIHTAILSESESKSELCNSTKCGDECLYIESMRDKPHKVKVNETMLCEDFSETNSFITISSVVSHITKDYEKDPFPKQVELRATHVQEGEDDMKVSPSNLMRMMVRIHMCFP